MLRFVILHIRKCQLKYVKVFNSQQTKWNTNTNLQYDQILTAADISSSRGNCFCVIYSSQRESDFKLQKFKLESCGVGEVEEMIEPSFTRRTLGDSDVPILEHNRPLVPVRPLEKLLKDDDEVPFEEDKVVSFGSRFFFMKHVCIHMQNVLIEHPICTGFMCDRQEIK